MLNRGCKICDGKGYYDKTACREPGMVMRWCCSCEAGRGLANDLGSVVVKVTKDGNDITDDTRSFYRGLDTLAAVDIIAAEVKVKTDVRHV